MTISRKISRSIDHGIGHSARRLLQLFSLLFLAACVQAESPASADLAAIKKAVAERIAAVRPDLQVVSLAPAPIDGLYEAQIQDGPLIYVTADGGFFVTGDVYAVEAEGIVNLAERKRDVKRQALLTTLDEKDMIVFAPEKTRATVTVFTDVDCGYCQKLHQEVPELNRLGIKVRYLAFPRSGVDTATYNKLVSAWCAADPQDAMTKLKARQTIAQAKCENPVAEQYALGQVMGVTGTPAMVTDDGRLLPGYMPANALAATLGLQ